VFNESGADKDFRAEGDTDANLLFLDASTDRMGVGTATPGAKLDVTGDIHMTWAVSSDRFVGAKFSTTYELGMHAVEASRETQIVSKAADGNAKITFLTGATPTERMRIDNSGNLIVAVTGTAPSLSTNSSMTFELASDTSLKIVVRGSDGTTRSATLTLA
jgi:hypothetical protein